MRKVPIEISRAGCMDFLYVSSNAVHSLFGTAKICNGSEGQADVGGYCFSSDRRQIVRYIAARTWISSFLCFCRFAPRSCPKDSHSVQARHLSVDPYSPG